jgi:hypothetical protein
MMGSVNPRAWLNACAAVVLVVVGFGCSATPDANTGPGGTVLPPGPAGQAGASGAAGAGMIPVNPMGGTAGTGVQVIPPGGSMPCAVETVVKNSCQGCHGAQPIGGAPMSLLTRADFQKDWMVRTTTQLAGRTMKMYELARIRVNQEMGTGVMPQGAVQFTDSDKTMLTSWLQGGAPEGTACATPPGTAGTGPTGMAGTGGGTAGSTGNPNPMGEGTFNRCVGPDAIADALEPLVARDGETCWEFLTHGVSSPTDTTPFSVPRGETYNQFYYKIPWPANSVATRFGADFDNLPVLHHWLGFFSQSNNPDGHVAREVTGTTLGESSELVGGWAVGGCNVVMPDNIGLKMPDTGRIMIQWHHNNSTGSAQPDSTKVQWCTVPAAMREHVAGITFLGTEDFNGLIGMPPGESNYTTQCTNNSQGPITIIGFTPHMHLLGSNMQSWLEGGQNTPVFNQPFKFDQQYNYLVQPYVVLEPGDTIWTRCSFNNTTGGNVAFGQPTTSEMCYNFAIAYPYDALNSGNISLIGATNTCWGTTTPAMGKGLPTGS